MTTELEYLKRFVYKGVFPLNNTISNLVACNGKVTATDNNILFFSGIDADETYIDESPKINPIIPKDVTYTEYSRSKILDVLNQIPLKQDEEDIECDECDGVGEVDWEYGAHTKMDECPVCGGDGVSGYRKVETYSYDYDHYVEVFGAHFNPNYIKAIVEYPECSDAIKLGIDGDKLCFDIGKCTGVLMKCVPEIAFGYTSHKLTT